MPLFECSQCGCYDNTATSNYWARAMPMEGPPLPAEQAADVIRAALQGETP